MWCQVGDCSAGEVNSEWTRDELLFYIHPEGVGAPHYAIRDNNDDLL